MNLETEIKNAVQSAKEEIELGFPARIQIDYKERNFTIDTRITRDSRYSNNGGDYSFWLKVWDGGGGDTLSEERSTCDFWNPQDEPDYWLGFSWDEAAQIVIYEAMKSGVPMNLETAVVG